MTQAPLFQRFEHICPNIWRASAPRYAGKDADHTIDDDVITEMNRLARVSGPWSVVCLNKYRPTVTSSQLSKLHHAETNDFEVPPELRAIAQRIETERECNPVLVYCGAGCGRTGTALAAWNILHGDAKYRSAWADGLGVETHQQHHVLAELSGIKGRALQALELVAAGLSLLKRSSIVTIRDRTLAAMQECAFIEFCGADRFARVAAWIHFSTGVEYLLKGVCVANDVSIEGIKAKVLTPPISGSDLEAWYASPSSDTITKSLSLGQLGASWSPDRELGDGLAQLCRNRNAPADTRRRLHLGLALLTSSVRNRDLHAFRADVRGEQFVLVEKMFAGCLNTLLGWLPPEVQDALL